MPNEKSSLWTGLAAGVVGALFINVIFFGFLKPLAPVSTPKQATQPTSNTVVDVVKAANPAVVSIVITKEVPVYEQVPQTAPSPFNPFFGFGGPTFTIPQQRQTGTKKQEVGGGSGFLVSADGSVVTNNHVVSDEKAQYTVILSDGTKYEAKVVAKDAVLDVAVLKITGTNFPFLTFEEAGLLEVGETVIAIGNPLNEFRNTVSVGVISGLARSITARAGQGSEQLDGLIQTDAAINPGNSGGPLLNLQGKVVGVNVAVAGGAENIGFALRGDFVKQAVDSVLAVGRVVRPWLGVRFIPITAEVKEKEALSVDSGALVKGDAQNPGVVKDSPAQKAGVQEGDILLKLDDQAIDEAHALPVLVRAYHVGDQVRLTVLRAGTEMVLTATLEEIPAP